MNLSDGFINGSFFVLLIVKSWPLDALALIASIINVYLLVSFIASFTILSIRMNLSMFSSYLIFSPSVKIFLFCLVRPGLPDRWMHISALDFLMLTPISLMIKVPRPVDVRSICYIVRLCFIIFPMRWLTKIMSCCEAFTSEILFHDKFRFFSFLFWLRTVSNPFSYAGSIEFQLMSKLVIDFWLPISSLSSLNPFSFRPTSTKDSTLKWLFRCIFFTSSKDVYH